MKLSRTTCTTAILFLAAAISAYGQKEDKDQPQHNQQQQKAEPQHQQVKQPQQPRPQPQQAKPSPVRQPEQHAPTVRQQQASAPAAHPAPRAVVHSQTPQVERSARTAKSWQQDRGWQKQGGGWQPHTNFQQGRDQNWASDHRTWAQRGGYGGSYIPQLSFSQHFGSSHSFRIGVLPVMYMGYPRFAYGGYSFMLVDPWPGSWQENWYSSDDVYIDYSDGYYLHNRRYPGVRLAITVVL